MKLVATPKSCRRKDLETRANTPLTDFVAIACNSNSSILSKSCLPLIKYQILLLSMSNHRIKLSRTARTTTAMFAPL